MVANTPRPMVTTSAPTLSRQGGPPPKPREIEPIFPGRPIAWKPAAAKRGAVARHHGAEALARVRREIDLEALLSQEEAVSPEAKATDVVIARIAGGAKILRARPQPDETGFIVGFDFGTSCSKIVIHQTGAGDLAYALPAPTHLQVREHGVAQEHLWRSVVWLDKQSGAFSLGPVVGGTRLEGFKTGLIKSDGHRMVEGVTRVQATTAYLALLIAYTLGYHRLAAPRGFNRKAHFSRFHFGIPVACKDEGACAAVFSRALTAAFQLAPRAPDIDLSAVTEFVRLATPAAKVTGTTPFLMFEELAGVIAGYRASPDARTGPHVVVDVGAATLDVATFHIPNEGDHMPVPVYMSGVELLGAGALEAARRKQISDETFSLACNQHTRHVINHTFLNKNPSFTWGNGVPKPLLLVGGGRQTALHDHLYRNYPAGLQAPLVTPEPGTRMGYDAHSDFARLLLAWGLSQEDVMLPKLKPPSEIEDYVQKTSDYTRHYVDKDMC